MRFGRTTLMPRMVATEPPTTQVVMRRGVDPRDGLGEPEELGRAEVGGHVLHHAEHAALDEARTVGPARISAPMPRSTRCWLAERAKSPPARVLRIRAKAIAP